MSTFAPAVAHESKNKSDVVKFIGERHRHWTARHVVKGQRDSWRPKLVHRQAAEKYLKLLDNQVRGSSCFGGLESFRFIEGDERWVESSWRVWPSMTIAADQGSDGVSALHSLMYKQSIAYNVRVQVGVRAQTGARKLAPARPGTSDRVRA